MKFHDSCSKALMKHSTNDNKKKKKTTDPMKDPSTLALMSTTTPSSWLYILLPDTFYPSSLCLDTGRWTARQLCSANCHGDCQCYCYNNNSFINNIVWRAIIISLILIFIFKCEKKGAGSCWSGLFVHIMMYNRTLDHVDGIRGVCGDCRRWTSSHFPPFLPSTYINQKHNTLH